MSPRCGAVVAVCVALGVGTGMCHADDPQITNVRARQIAGTGQVEVVYDLSGAPAGGATVSVEFSATGDAPYDITPTASALSGDVGAGVGDGSDRRIVWDAASTLPPDTHGTTYRAEVTAVEPAGDGDVLTIVLPGGVEMDLVWVPAGDFWMGSPDDERGRSPFEDLHLVTLNQGYYLGKHEVTQAQWEAVMGTAIPASCGDHGTGPSFPAYCVSWDDVCGGATGSDCLPNSFVGRIGSYLGDTRFRLPSEAEWENAARAGSQAPFSFGDDLACSVDGCNFCTLFGQFIWWCGNAANSTQPVGLKLPNNLNLYDMHGNVFEWVGDWWTTHLGTDPQTDPAGPASGAVKVFRGGSFTVSPRFCRSAYRSNLPPTSRYENIGFRVARSP